MIFYLKCICSLIFITSLCFADGIAYIRQENEQRRVAFNRDISDPNISTCTQNINNILRNKEKVNQRRQASFEEKEIILKTVMTSILIHRNDSTCLLPKHELTAADAFFKHFEILRLTESLALNLASQYEKNGSININLFNIYYTNLYNFSNVNADTYARWFNNILETHHSGLQQRQMNFRIAGSETFSGNKRVLPTEAERQSVANFKQWKPNFLIDIEHLYEQGLTGNGVNVLITEGDMGIPYIPAFGLTRSTPNTRNDHAANVISIARKIAMGANLSACNNYIGQRNYMWKPLYTQKRLSESEEIINSVVYDVCNMSWAWACGLSVQYVKKRPDYQQILNIIKGNKLWKYPEMRQLYNLLCEERTNSDIANLLEKRIHQIKRLRELFWSNTLLSCELFSEQNIGDEIYREFDIWEALNQKPQTLFVRSTGNNSEKLIDKGMYLIAYEAFQNRDLNVDNILWVANVTADGILAKDSNYPGDEFKDHTICALGTNVDVILSNQTFTKSNGTSLAAPIVTGVAALLKEKFQSFTPFDIKTCLLRSADKYRLQRGRRIPLDQTQYGQGILNPKHALLYAQQLAMLREENQTLAANDITVIEAYERSCSSY